MTAIGVGTLWWVIASSLMYVAWNKVLVVMYKWPKAKWWYPFVVLATVVALSAPCMLAKRRHGRHCQYEGGMHMKGGSPEATPDKD
ncbi:MAG: hypothetical protein IT285_07465 [Bdellovibrionales bacterium]|nr:hypothetical protein [Bdellovibrionales bacterium]